MTKFSHKLGYVLASKYRKKVLLALKDKTMMPVDISKKTSIHLSHISTVLKELSERNLVVCINPKLKKGRLYELTKEGRKLLKEIS